MGNGVFTPNYGFYKPDKTDLMSDVTNNLNNNWDLITGIPAPPSITGALPQSGSYNIGDRVYRTNDQSSYILIAKDSTWGWYWRPVQAAISPWITVPSAAVTLAGWSGSVLGSNPFAIALDNRGNCHWRGAIGVTSGVITANTSFTVLATLPTGIIPREQGMYQLGYYNFGAATGEIEGGRIFLNENGTSSIRVQGSFATTNQISRLYFESVVRYSIGTDHWTTP